MRQTSSEQNTDKRLTNGPEPECAAGYHSPSGLYFHSCPPVQGPAIARLLLLPGYGDHAGRYQHLYRWFARHQIATRGIDFRGHGKSIGRRGYIRRWPEFLDDLQRFLDWERDSDRSCDCPWFLLGHSHGGLVTAAAGIEGRLRGAGCAGGILSSPYLRPATLLPTHWRLFAEIANHIVPGINVRSGLTPQMMTRDPTMWADSDADLLLNHGATPRWYVQTMRKQAQIFREAGQFQLPLLCLLGDADSIADCRASEHFVELAGSADKKIIRYPDARHELLREINREQIFTDILEWVTQRVG